MARKEDTQCYSFLLSVPNKAAEYFAGNLPIVTSLTDGTLLKYYVTVIRGFFMTVVTLFYIKIRFFF